MNTKKVKRLRKEIGYHPSQPRKYEGKGIIELHAADKRSLYQQMKREVKSGQEA